MISDQSHLAKPLQFVHIVLRGSRYLSEGIIMDKLCTRIFGYTKLLWSKSNRWHKGFLIFALIETRIFPGGQVGFHCNDPALSHPYTGDTISWKLLLATVIILPLVVMLIVERKYHTNKRIKPKDQALYWYREYLFGVLLNLITIQLMKSIVGSPRPHFFDTCSPKEALTCEGSEYIESYTCTKAHWLNQSDRSFPSGHTSLAFHAAIYLAYYLTNRSKANSASIIAIQLVLLTSATFCSVSRMSDHRHHWWDVVAGAAISLPLLWYTIRNLCKNFDCSVSDEEAENLKNGTGAYVKT